MKLTAIKGFIRPHGSFSAAVVKTTYDNTDHRLVTNTASKNFFDESLLAAIKFLNKHIAQTVI